MTPTPGARALAFHLGPLCGVLDSERGWLRLFGYGVQWRDTTRTDALFSERRGHVRHWRVGRWSVRLLRGWGSP